MYYGDYGNYDNRTIDRTKDYEFAKTRNGNNVVNTKNAEIEKPLFNFKKNVDAPSSDALGAYGKATFNMGQKGLSFAKELKVSNNDATTMGRYITPEQQTRVSEDMLTYFG